MNRSISVAVVLLLCGSPSIAVGKQSVEDIARREEAVRRYFSPAFEEAMRPPLAASWEHFPADEVDWEELAVAQSAHIREVDATVHRLSAQATSIVARHVPLEEIDDDADALSPGWQAAMAEVMALVEQSAEREGFEMAMRVIEAGCSAKQQPSSACAAMMTMVTDVRAGRLDIDDFKSD